jgi:hypothetical protein
MITTILNNRMISTITQSFLYLSLDLTIHFVRFKVQNCRAIFQLSVAILINLLSKGKENYKNYFSIISVRRQ